MRDVLRGGAAGLLVDPQKSGQLAVSISNLMNDDSLRKRLVSRVESQCGNATHPGRWRKAIGTSMPQCCGDASLCLLSVVIFYTFAFP